MPRIPSCAATVPGNRSCRCSQPFLHPSRGFGEVSLELPQCQSCPQAGDAEPSSSILEMGSGGGSAGTQHWSVPPEHVPVAQ